MTSTEGPVALITGGGTGVGRASSLQLARRGLRIAVNYSRSEEDALQTVAEARDLAGDACAYCCDVADESAVRQMVVAIEQRFGRLDVVVNNAACTEFVPLADLDAMTTEMWQRIFDVNLMGAFNVSRTAAPLLKRQQEAAIVNVASVAGITGVGSCIAYAASKGALITLTKSLATALAPQIRVNAVCPGVIVSRWLDDHPEMIETAVSQTPLKRASRPEDVADVIEFLACDAKMMTGQSVVVDGGKVMA